MGNTFSKRSSDKKEEEAFEEFIRDIRGRDGRHNERYAREWWYSKNQMEWWYSKNQMDEKESGCTKYWSFLPTK